MSSIPLSVCVDSANTGLDAIKRAPIVEHDTGIKCLRIQDISQCKDYDDWGFTEVTPENFKRFQLKKGDILIARTGGSIGVNRYIEENLQAVYNNGLIRVRVDTEKYYPKFVFYLLRTESFQQHINAIAFSTAAQPNMKIKDFLRFEFLDLPLEVQIQIADNLSNIDHKTELNRQTNQTLEQIAQAIFKSWFVDFEPTRAKIAVKKRWQAVNEVTETSSPTCYAEELDRTNQATNLRNLSLDEAMNQAAMVAISGKTLEELEQLSSEQLQELRETAALFPDSLVESELGEIPEGWDASTLGQHFNVVMGQSPKGDTYNEEGEGMLFFQGRRDFGFRYPSPRVFTTAPKRLAQAGDTLISVRAPVGDRNMANQECCLGRGVASIRHKTGASSFTYAFIGHIENSLSDSGSDGTVFSSINKKELAGVNYVAPDERLLCVFETVVGALDQRVEVNSTEIESLEEIRDSLLPKLLSGDLKTEGKRDSIEECIDDSGSIDLSVEKLSQLMPFQSYISVRRDNALPKSDGIVHMMVVGEFGEGGVVHIKVPRFLNLLEEAIEAAGIVPFLGKVVAKFMTKAFAEKVVFDQSKALALLCFPRKISRTSAELLERSVSICEKAGVPPFDELSLGNSLKELESHGLVKQVDDSPHAWKLMEKFEHSIMHW